MLCDGVLVVMMVAVDGVGANDVVLGCVRCAG